MNSVSLEQNTSTKKEEINKMLQESQDMVGEKTIQEGVFQKIFRGYIPLDFLSLLNTVMNPEEKTKIDAYCLLLKIALRRNEKTLDYLLKGYGTDMDEIQFKETAYSEYKEEKEKLKNYEIFTEKTLKAPDLALAFWLGELKITPDTLSPALLNPFQIDQDAYVPEIVLNRMSQIGLFKMKVPKKYGGLGFSQKQYDLVLRTLAHIS